MIPLKGAEFRCSPDNQLRVYRSEDGGKNWLPFGNGLPQKDAFMSVYRGRNGDRLPGAAGIYFGTNTGKLFGSKDEGESGPLIADNLPPIFSVETAEYRSN